MTSAHDCSEGGLAVALAELCIPNGIGFTGEPILPRRWDAALFGEGQSRIVVAVPHDRWLRLQEVASSAGAPLLRLGVTGGSRFTWGHWLDLPVDEISDAWSNGLEQALA